MVDKKKRLKPIQKASKGDAGRERLKAVTPRSQVAPIVPPRTELTQIEQPLFGPPVRPREFTPLRKNPHFWNEKLTAGFSAWAVLIFLIFFETAFIIFLYIRR